MQMIPSAKPVQHQAAGTRYIGANPVYQVFENKADIPENARDITTHVISAGVVVYVAKVAKGVPFRRVQS